MKSNISNMSELELRTIIISARNENSTAEVREMARNAENVLYERFMPWVADVVKKRLRIFNCGDYAELKARRWEMTCDLTRYILDAFIAGRYQQQRGKTVEWWVRWEAVNEQRRRWSAEKVKREAGRAELLSESPQELVKGQHAIDEETMIEQLDANEYRRLFFAALRSMSRDTGWLLLATQIVIGGKDAALARQFKRHRSTVSRHLKRARRELHRELQRTFHGQDLTLMSVASEPDAHAVDAVRRSFDTGDVGFISRTINHQITRLAGGICHVR